MIEIDAALERIESGTYGICEMSGDPIPIPRLRAIPFARLTVECQSKVEKQSKKPPSPLPIPSLFFTEEEEETEEEKES
ncbi:MAG: TraR/DksA family transcriptional regulator [Chthoniobacterales bacterium]|jgi:RNA polymerase-binding transcription factor DksA|nr:TraR/DksA family transcriptional regulator [Chthoniobacterales bacterium]